jgi:hypothetical protein
MIMESGLREDVMVGRGWAKKPSNDGGRGRGPSGEVCLVQAHPSELWRWTKTVNQQAAHDKALREVIAQSLLGADNLQDCIGVGLRMMMHSKKYCTWQTNFYPDLRGAKIDWDFAMFSLYGTGNSCVDHNNGKTMARVQLFRKIYDDARKRWQTNVTSTQKLARF